MENEIKVGEYVRTKDGKIIKFNKFGTLRVGCTNPKYYKTIISNRRHYKYDDIVKHSPNLIDLIECGDYVNGQKVFNKLYDERNSCWYLKLEIGEVYGLYERTYEQHIKSIVTKEMMKSISYKVEGKDKSNE